MNLYLYGLIVPIFSFFLQIWPRLINRYFGIDTWRHLMYANYVRKYKKFPKEIRDKYLVVGPYGYPPVIIKILSFFPKSFNEKYQFIFSPVFDFFHNYFIFCVALLLTKDLTTGISAQIIAALTPLVVIEASNLNTRAISYLIYSLSLFPLLLFTQTHFVLWLALAFIGLVLLFYTHRFAVQAYLFCAIGLSIVERNPLYLIFFLAAFATVYALGGEFYKSILNEHLALLNFWRKNIDFRFAHQFRGNVKPRLIKDFVFKIYNLSFKSPFVYIVGNNPWLGIYFLGFLLPYIYNPFPGIIINNPMTLKLNLWVITLLISSILILSVKKLRFLGEGHRYLEYAVLPISILLGSYFSVLYGKYGIISILAFIVLCISMLVVIVFLQKKTIVADRGRTVGSELWEIINYLNKNVGKKVRLAVFPISLGDAMMYFLKGRVLTSDSIFGQIKLGILPVIKEPFYNFVVKYGLNHILVDQTYVSINELRLKNKKIVKNINNYILLKVQ